MEKRDSYFDSALSNFIFEFACGGAIRHLADAGYTSAQIIGKLQVPVSYERVREAVTAYFLEEGILLRTEPCEAVATEKYTYVQDHGKFGKTSFRKVPVKADKNVPEGEKAQGAVWTTREMTCKEVAEIMRNREVASRTAGEQQADSRKDTDGGRSAGQILTGQTSTEQKLTKQGRDYVSCDYGKQEVCAVLYEALNERQREYLEGIRWERRRMYHLLDARMREIVIKLCEAGLFAGNVYLGTERRILVTKQTEDM